MSQSTVIFFDIGNTLAAPVLSNGALKRLRVFPFIHEVLTRLNDNPAYRLGIISNTGTETLQTMQMVLSECGLMPLFEPGLMLFSSVEGLDKTQKAFFVLAAKRAKVAASRCVYVCEDQTERNTAKAAGFHVSFHPLHLFQLLNELG